MWWSTDIIIIIIVVFLTADADANILESRVTDGWYI